MRRPLLALAAATVALATSLASAPALADPRVGGDIGARYESLGGAGGLLGQPITGEVRTPNGRGAYVAFERGSIYWSPPTGAWEVHGAVREKWAQLGWEGGFLGFPRTDETRTPNGRGAYNVFEGGSIYFSPATGAHEVHGAIRDAYAWAGWEGGPLGFPTTDELATPGHVGGQVGAYAVFEGGSIYWSPWTGPGAHVVRGAIRDAWAAQGWEDSRLGMPTSSEFDIRGGKRQNFERGFIEWSPATGARINQTLTDRGIAGCPHFPTGASPEQAAGCVAQAWAAGRYDIVNAYASNAVTGQLHEWGRPDGRMTFSGCEHDPQSPIVNSSLGIECSAYFDDPSWVHGWALYMGIDDHGYGAVVGHIDTIG